MSRPVVLAIAAALAIAVAGRAPAQDRADSTPPLVRYGKWAALGAAAAATSLGAVAHERADDDYGVLLDYCRGSGACLLGGDGRYADATAEDLYQRVVHGDRRARAWLIGGQAALITAAVLFVVELQRARGPRNIPFDPYASATPGRVLVGVSVPMP